MQKSMQHACCRVLGLLCASVMCNAHSVLFCSVPSAFEPVLFGFSSCIGYDLLPFFPDSVFWRTRVTVPPTSKHPTQVSSSATGPRQHLQQTHPSIASNPSITGITCNRRSRPQNRNRNAKNLKLGAVQLHQAFPTHSGTFWSSGPEVPTSDLRPKLEDSKGPERWLRPNSEILQTWVQANALGSN